MSEHLSVILDRALARLEAGEPVESILADYSSQRDELAPLLAAAQELSSLRAVPSPAEPEAGLESFLAGAKAAHSDLASQPRLGRWLTNRLAALRNLWWYPRTRLVVRTMAALALFFVLMGGTITLAADSLPGDWLYPVKLASEEIHLSLTFNQTARAEYHLVRARTRAEEIQHLVQAGRSIDETTLARMNRSLEACLLATASADLNEIPRLLATIQETTIAQTSLLAAASATAITARDRELLDRARLSLTQAWSLARAGQTDLHAFLLHARLGMLQIGQPSPASSETDLPTATITPTPTSGVQATPMVGTQATPTSRAQTAEPTATATASPSPSATTRPTDTPTPTKFTEPSPTPTPSYTPKPTSTPSHSPEPPSPTSTPQPPGQTDTPQPPGQTKTPQPPGQTKSPEPPAPTKPPKPTKKP
jgi:hypothetical protein